MHFTILTEKTRYLKENPKGVSEMCKVMEDLRDESDAEGLEYGEVKKAKEMALKLNQKGTALKEIADLVGFDIATVEKWLTPKTV